MYIFLDENDAPEAADREAAIRIIQQIITDDTFSPGRFVIEGYTAARRIAQALTAARRDERRKGFDTPFRMRKTKPAPGAPAVLAEHPNLRPLYHWIEVDGVRLQSYRGPHGEHKMFSDDGRIGVEERPDFWNALVNGMLVRSVGANRHFATPEEAARVAMDKLSKSL